MGKLQDQGFVKKNRWQSTLESEAVAVESVTDLVKSKPSVLVCMEAKPQYCHRSQLAKVVSNRSRLQVTHLTYTISS